MSSATARRRAGPPTRRQRVGRSLTPPEWRRAGLLFGVVLLLHFVGFGLLFNVVVPANITLGTTGAFGVGLGITAYTLGMRHAFDADHIGAIDNVTRKLMADGQRPLSVGFFFALGHSSIVFLLAAALALGIRALGGAVQDDDSTLQQAASVIGPTVSGSFLLLIGVLNLVVLIGVLKVFRRMRHGEYDEQALEEQLNSRGFMNRFLGRATRAIRRPWQMYPLGMLFGLGFDTATEVALLATASSAAAGGLPLYAILCLPILFAAGMTLLDTIDGAFTTVAYGWAFAKPVRKVFYNITITGLSVVVALGIGIIELVQVLTERLGLEGGAWAFFTALDLNAVGYVVVALFVLTWAVAISVWRFGRIEQRWTANLQPREEPS